MNKPTLGFVGLGRMGTPMTRRLLAAGNAVTVFDPVASAVQGLVAQGATAAANPREVANAADIVFASLPTPDVVRRVALDDDGVARGTRARIFVDLSTTGPRMAASLAETFARRGVRWIDSPVSGGVGGAKAGTLAVMYSGPRGDFDALQEQLRVIGKPFYIGPDAGLAQTMKLVNNMLSAAAMALTSEAVVMGAKAGLDPDVMIDVINAGSGRK